ncbi:MAG: pyrroline-5-carboxylate reductase [Defluviitaleaceae bacterium]|nr:pyrroline-5-carboxylate reductase [Defluviitaleaceae bacterium]
MSIKKDLKLGFIGGTGNMGSAIIGGVLKSNFVRASNILVSSTNEAKLNKIKETYNVYTSLSNEEIASKADIIFLCIKPHIYSLVIEEIRKATKKGAIIVIIAAGQSLASVTEKFNRPDLKIIKTMPNTPSLVNSGITAIVKNETSQGLNNSAQLASSNSFHLQFQNEQTEDIRNLTKEDTELVFNIFETIGKVTFLNENLFDAFTGIAGSSPAYAFMFIEAMADAGVKHGIPRDQAIKFSAQALLGAASMVLETGKHPAELKDAVCSPGGATIAAVCELERQGFRNAIISGVSACVEKSKAMKE